MKKETYIKLMAFIKARSRLYKIIKTLYTALPFVMFIVYPIIVIYKAFTDMGHGFLLSLIVPAVTLLGSAAARKLINKPRPYEKFATPSLIQKDRQGQSFPSNHAACAFVIAMTAFGVSLWVWAALMIVAVGIALSRVFAGVHFISDVVAGSVFGILAGAIFLFI